MNRLYNKDWSKLCQVGMLENIVQRKVLEILKFEYIRDCYCYNNYCLEK